MGHTPDEIAAYVFLDIAVIVVVARLMGALFRRLRQPAVIGEIVGGIALGPSLLGTLPGDLTGVLFPEDVRPYLRVVAQLGLVIFMFIVGLELDLRLVRGKEKAAATISICSVALPFGLGVALAFGLHGNHDQVRGEQVELLPFALFIGASMSVTAFPVLARILTERGMQRTQVGALTLACAAVDDVLAWSILAVVLAVVAATGALGLPLVLLESVAFVAFVFLVVRPALRALVPRYERAGRLTPDVLAVVVVGFLVCAFVTHEIGIHSIFGAFLFGVVMPREGSGPLTQEILEKLEQVSVLLLLPVFFVSTGLDVDIGGLGGTGVLELLAVLAVACTGKFVGAAGAARALGMPGRRAAAIGVLMNTRGLTELVLLNIGLSVGVLDAELFTVLVLMAVFTTVITEPLLRLVYPDRLLARDVAEAARAALGLVAAYRVVVLLERGSALEDLVDTGAALLHGEQPAELLLTRLDRPVKLELGAGLSAELTSVAASFDALQTLVHRAEQAGAHAVARSQFSPDPAADLLAQLVAVEADVVLLDARATPVEVLERVLADAECAVVLAVDAGGTLSGAPSTRLTVLPGGGDDGPAAVEQAVRLARSGSAPVVLAEATDRRDGRRLQRTAEQLRAAGVRVELQPAGAASGPGGLRVVGLAAWRSGRTLSASLQGEPAAGSPLLVVRAAQEDRGERLAALLAAPAPASRS